MRFSVASPQKEALSQVWQGGRVLIAKMSQNSIDDAQVIAAWRCAASR
jgi:hypothetical protein